MAMPSAFSGMGITAMHFWAGLFVVGNYLAEAAVLVAIALALYRRLVLAALCLPAAILPMGRGALLAFIAALHLHLGELDVPVAILVPHQFVNGARKIVEAVFAECPGDIHSFA